MRYCDYLLIFIYQAKKYADYQQVWKENEAKLMRGQIAIMVLEDKLGSDKALKLLKKDIDKYYAGDEVQIVGSELLNFTWHICMLFHRCNV